MTKDTFELCMFQLFLSEEETFDLLYTSIRKEAERQKKLEKDYLEQNHISEKTMSNMNIEVLEDFLEQLKEQDAIAFLSAESVYNQKFNNQS